MITHQFVEPRKRFIEWVRRQLMGAPQSGSDGPDLRGVLPTERYPCGAIYPVSSSGEGIDPVGDDVEMRLHRIGGRGRKP